MIEIQDKDDPTLPYLLGVIKKVPQIAMIQLEKAFKEVCQNKLHIFVDFRIDLLRFFCASEPHVEKRRWRFGSQKSLNLNQKFLQICVTYFDTFPKNFFSNRSGCLKFPKSQKFLKKWVRDRFKLINDQFFVSGNRICTPYIGKSTLFISVEVLYGP